MTPGLPDVRASIASLHVTAPAGRCRPSAAGEIWPTFDRVHSLPDRPGSAILALVAERLSGVVTAVFGPLVRVQVGEEALVVPFRRRLRWLGETSDKRLVVGDRVVVDGAAPSLVVSEVGERSTTLSRRSPGENRPRVIASNVNQAVVVVAAVSPEPNLRLLDRLLVACHHAGIAPLVCVNKVDQGTTGIESWIGDYQDAGYQILLVSARTARGLGNLRRAVTGHTTLFCGASGVGKSALLNAIHPGYRLREGSISEATGKGRHTTSTAELLPLPGGGFVVDTPGVKEFGLWDLTPVQLTACFPDLRRFADACEFSSCGHESESDCGVRTAVERGRLSSRRYTSFLKLRDELVAQAAP
jgi:ribosome biogenesis GTPase